MAFVLQLFGGFRLVAEDGKSASLPDRARALLAYIAVVSSPVPRRMLAELLSAEGSERKQQATLRQALYLVRKATADSAVLSLETDLALNNELVSVDVRLFQRSIGRGDDRSLTEAVEIYRAPFLSACLPPALMAQVRLRDWVGVQDLAETLVALATEQGFPAFLAFGTYYRGWALVGRGQTTEGLALMQEGIARYRALGQELNVGPWLCGLAGCYLGAGRTEDALRCVGEASEVIERTEVGVMHAPLLWLRGELQLASAAGDLAAAEGDFHGAIGVARRQSNKFWQLRASTSLARLWREQGKRTEACDLLAPIYGWFTEGIDTPELEEAKALLEMLN